MGGGEIDFSGLPPALADFPRRWREEAVPALRALEAKRVRAVRQLFIVGIGGALASIAAGFFIHIAVGIFAFVGFVFLAVYPMANLQPKVKALVVGAATSAAGLDYQLKGFEPDRFAEFRQLDLLPNYSRRSVEDRLSGSHGGAGFILYEAHLEIERSDKDGDNHYDTVFRGLLGIVEFPSSALGTTILAREGGFFEVFGKGKGLKKAGLEDPKFEKAFTAWTTDQVEARYFLNPMVMQALLDLEGRFGGKRLRCAFLPGHLLFAIETGNWFEGGSMFKPLEDPKRAQELVNEMAAVFDLLETLAACAPKKVRTSPAQREEV